MLELIIFAMLLGFITIFLVKRTTSNIALEKDAETTRDDRDIQALRQMTPGAFESVIKGLLEDMDLRIVHSTWVNDEEIDILAHNPAPVIGGDYIVHGILVPEQCRRGR